MQYDALPEKVDRRYVFSAFSKAADIAAPDEFFTRREYAMWLEERCEAGVIELKGRLGLTLFKRKVIVSFGELSDALQNIGAVEDEQDGLKLAKQLIVLGDVPYSRYNELRVDEVINHHTKVKRCRVAIHPTGGIVIWSKRYADTRNRKFLKLPYI